MKLTAADVAEALTSGDNDYDDGRDGWFGLHSDEGTVYITWTDAETGSKQKFVAKVEQVDSDAD